MAKDEDQQDQRIKKVHQHVPNVAEIERLCLAELLRNGPPPLQPLSAQMEEVTASIMAQMDAGHYTLFSPMWSPVAPPALPPPQMWSPVPSPALPPPQMRSPVAPPALPPPRTLSPVAPPALPPPQTLSPVPPPALPPPQMLSPVAPPALPPPRMWNPMAPPSNQSHPELVITDIDRIRFEQLKKKKNTAAAAAAASSSNLAGNPAAPPAPPQMEPPSNQIYTGLTLAQTDRFSFEQLKKKKTAAATFAASSSLAWNAGHDAFFSPMRSSVAPPAPPQMEPPSNQSYTGKGCTGKGCGKGQEQEQAKGSSTSNAIRLQETPIDSQGSSSSNTILLEERPYHTFLPPAMNIPGTRCIEQKEETDVADTEQNEETDVADIEQKEETDVDLTL